MAFTVLTVAGVVAWLIFRQQPQRDAAAGQSWAEFHRNATGNGWSMLYIQNVYQHAHRGSKATVSIYGDAVGLSRDAWFWWEHVKRGSVVAVSLSQGWGPHTRRDDVLYIGSGEPAQRSGVHTTFGPRELVRAQRNFRRQAAIRAETLANWPVSELMPSSASNTDRRAQQIGMSKQCGSQ